MQGDCMKYIIERHPSSTNLVFYKDADEYSGVVKIAAKVRNDINLVLGAPPSETCDINGLGKYPVLYGTLGKSSIMAVMEKNGLIDTKAVKGKRESYIFKFVEKPYPGVECALVIAGSDKRGTIYGLFHLSEILGVS